MNPITFQQQTENMLSVLNMELRPTLQCLELQEQSVLPNGITLFSQYITGVLALGELEHTGDWDPYLVIQTKRGIILTSQGYQDLIQSPNGVTIIIDEDQDQLGYSLDETTNLIDEGYEILPILIPYSELISIQLHD